ncbi:conserved hypothetical protein [Hyphomicrobiales bacterium]|nr:conserved hypothetical protein [Hyphomicrobiales bacterium]CAH1663788.1 conserved hypothetical protein [Hyphomicrobiales bacterium]
MSEVVQIKRQDEWQFRVDVYRRPDGTMHACLIDARTSLIEAGSMTPAEKLQKMASLLEAAARNMGLSASDIEWT